MPETAHSPRLFVLVPFFEGLDLLQSCIRSLRHQQAAFTAVFIDDGSSASTRRLVRELLAIDSRFILIERPTRQGPAAARLTGLNFICERATSDDDVVVLLDGDDRFIRDTALAQIARRYRDEPRLRMTFGRSITDAGQRFHRRGYHGWQLRLGLPRHLLEWRGDHPRTFRLSLFEQCRAQFRFQYPNGQWMQGATDMALILPMLDRCRPKEVAHLDATLYEYHFGRADGRTLSRQERGRLEQLVGEYFARRSLWYGAWKLVRYPQRSLKLLRHGLGKFESNQPPDDHDALIDPPSTTIPPD